MYKYIMSRNYPDNSITERSDTPITYIDNLRTKYNFAKRNDYVSYLTLNTALNEPNLGTSDVMKRDSQNMIVQQNTLYIIGTVTAATCLVLAIMFGYND